MRAWACQERKQPLQHRIPALIGPSPLDGLSFRVQNGSELSFVLFSFHVAVYSAGRQVRTTLVAAISHERRLPGGAGVTSLGWF